MISLNVFSLICLWVLGSGFISGALRLLLRKVIAAALAAMLDSAHRIPGIVLVQSL